MEDLLLGLDGGLGKIVCNSTALQVIGMYVRALILRGAAPLTLPMFICHSTAHA